MITRTIQAIFPHLFVRHDAFDYPCAKPQPMHACRPAREQESYQLAK